MPIGPAINAEIFSQKKSGIRSMRFQFSVQTVKHLEYFEGEGWQYEVRKHQEESEKGQVSSLTLDSSMGSSSRLFSKLEKTKYATINKTN